MLTNRYKQWTVGLFLSLAFVSVTTSAHATLFTFSETIRNDLINDPLIRDTFFSGSFNLPDPGTLPFNFDEESMRTAGTIATPFSVVVLLDGTTELAIETFDIFRANSSNLSSFGSLSTLVIENGELVAVRANGRQGRFIDFDGSARRLTVGIPFGPISPTTLRPTFFSTSTRSNAPSSIPLVASPVPEPSTALLFMTGLLGLAGYQWHQRRREKTQVG